MTSDTVHDASPPGEGEAAAPRQRGHVRIVVWLLFGLFSVVALLALLAGLTLTGIRDSNDEILRAQQSVAQMENVQRIEAAFNAYLLNEVRRRLNNDADLGEANEAARLRGALLAYRRLLALEIAAARTDEDRDEEREDIFRAATLTQIFETVERQSLLDRRPGATGAAPSAQSFLALVAENRDRIFQEVIAETLSDERAEVEEAFSRLEALRRRLLVIGGAVAAAFMIAMIACGALFYRGLMRPIRRLADAVEGEPGDAAPRPAPEDVPGEFAVLARRFNAMVARVGTEQGRLQAEVAARTADLRAANASLRDVDSARRAFFANISHELRTPLTVLLGEAQIALRAPGDERPALERIAASGGYLRRRMDDLMKLARSEDGALSLASEPFELGDPVAAAVETVRTYAQSKSVEVTLAPAAPRRVTGDREAISQAALALIDNAIKFSPRGGAVTVRVSDAGFSVADQGPGFGDTDAEGLFDRYAQAEGGRRRGGSGLGLAIVKWIADQHGATMRVEDGPTGGALIAMEFPA
ncbi:MAG: HAMP domain-containing sensor histidine kinase [Pseudomonadota bacterium]